MKFLRLGTLAICAAMLTGCFGSDVQDFEGTLVPVSGTLTVDGAPIKGVSVSFAPDIDAVTKGTGASGMTDDKGHFVLKHRTDKEGVEAGKYKVTFFKFVMPDGSDIPADTEFDSPSEIGAKNMFPPKYADPTKTKEVADVPAGGKEFTFDVKLKK